MHEFRNFILYSIGVIDTLTGLILKSLNGISPFTLFTRDPYQIAGRIWVHEDVRLT